jgi:hypothetical protein
MEPIQHTLGLRVEIHLQLPDGAAAIGKKRHLLVLSHSLSLGDLKEAPFGFGVVGVDTSKAFRGACCGDTLPREDFKPPGFAAALIPRLDIAAIQPHSERRIGFLQAFLLLCTSLDEHCLPPAQHLFHPLGYPE